jgi:methionyl-tRNA formyltransferase
MAEIDWTQTNVRIFNLVRALTRPFPGTWTLVSGHKLSVWKTQLVAPEMELKTNGALPGEVLAVTGKGLWVQCGQGQLKIVDSSFEDHPDVTPAERINFVGEKIKILLG